MRSNFKKGQTVYTFYWNGPASPISPHVQKGKIARFIEDRSMFGPYDFFDIELEDGDRVMKVWPGEIFKTAKQAKEALIQNARFYIDSWTKDIRDSYSTIKKLQSYIKLCGGIIEELEKSELI